MAKRRPVPAHHFAQAQHSVQAHRPVPLHHSVEQRTLRVLHVTQPTSGGVATYVAQAAADQQRRGWQVAVACPPQGELAQTLSHTGIPVLAWQAGRAPDLQTLSETWQLRRIVRAFTPDVVHLHSAKAGLAGRLLNPRQLRQHGLIFQPHGWSWLAGTAILARASKAWERMAATTCDALVCVGQGELHQGQDARIRGPLLIVRNGVDLTRFRPFTPSERHAARAALGIPEEVPLALCIGRHSRQKGQDVLMSAWPSVLARCPQARLAFVGMEPPPRHADSVSFIPPVADPRPWLAACNVAVMPSRWEGLPLTALETLATGRSLVGTAIPGLTEVVTSGTGELVPVECPEALAQAVAARLVAPDLADAEGAEGAERAATFDVTRTLDRLCALTTAIAAAFPNTPHGAQNRRTDSPSTDSPSIAWPVRAGGRSGGGRGRR
ncbi:glycosyltransferase [Spirillospora sp. NPDC048911]|uniref:glycosyltransferase n=1 Tax=Spirillospora sp. NPDC048911 TaxID=3364527 RepID=UPI003716C51E